MIPPVVHSQADEKPNMVNWKNTFSMRQISLMNLAASQLGNKNGSKNIIPQFRRNYSVTSPSKSLDLLRKNLQSAINKDIDNVIKKYLDKFFEPAIANIKDNVGKDSVGEDHIKEVCKNILEEAKLMYKIAPGSRDSSPYDCSDSEASTADSRIGRMSPPPRKRKEFEHDISDPNHKRHKSLISTPDFTNYKLPIKREGPKWNPDRITENTLFIMGPRANKVLGYGQTRGRLYVRHPELVRYSGDQEDKEWLASKNLMPPSGGKAYLMILEDIKELTESDDYKNNPNLQLHELKGFEAPLFMINKIRVFIQQVRTDRRDFLDFHCFSLTPPVVSDSAPSTPSDNTQIMEGHSTTNTKCEGAYIHIPDISPSSTNSIISSTMTQSPIPNCGEFLTPNMLMTISNADIGSNENIMILKDIPQEVCLSSLLSTHINENTLNF